MPGLEDQANALVDAGRHEAAVKILKAAIRENPDDAVLHATLGGCLIEMKRKREGMAALRHALALGPSDAYVRYCIGRGLADTGQFVEALKHAEAAREIDASDPDFVCLLALIKLRWGYLEEAQKLALEALALDPEHSDAKTIRALALSAQGDSARAREAAAESMAADPEDANSLYAAAWNTLARGDWNEAARLLGAAVARDPSMFEARRALTLVELARTRILGWVLRSSIWVAARPRTKLAIRLTAVLAVLAYSWMTPPYSAVAGWVSVAALAAYVHYAVVPAIVIGSARLFRRAPLLDRAESARVLLSGLTAGLVVVIVAVWCLGHRPEALWALLPWSGLHLHLVGTKDESQLDVPMASEMRRKAALVVLAYAAIPAFLLGPIAGWIAVGLFLVRWIVPATVRARTD